MPDLLRLSSRLAFQKSLSSRLVLLLSIVLGSAAVSAGHDLEIDDLESGRLLEVVYPSELFGPVDLLVYTPPGYLEPGGEPYPTIYWLHGSGEDHFQMRDALGALPGSGTAVERLDTLIRDGFLPPLQMVAVSSPTGVWGDDLLDLVTREIPDFVDRNYRTDPRRAGRGIEAFSLGIEGISRYVTVRPDRFASASLLGGGFLESRWTAAQTQILRDKLEAYLLIGELDSFLSSAQSLDTALGNLGVPHAFTLLPGVAHNVVQIYEDGGLGSLQWHAERWAEARLVDAGPDFDLDTALPAQVELQGAVDDPDGELGSFTLQWTQVSGPAAAGFDDPTSFDPVVTLPAAGTYHFELTATGNVERCDVVRVTVVDSAAGLAFYFPFDDGTAEDASANGRDGVLAGSPGIESSGRVGSALTFDGSDDSVTVADFEYGPNFSLSLWVRPVNLVGADYQYFLSHGAFDAAGSLNFYFVEDGATLQTPRGGAPWLEDFVPAEPLTKDGFDPVGTRAGSPRLRFSVRDNVADATLAQTQVNAASLLDGGWHHLALVAGPKPTYGHQIWIDGVPVAKCVDDGNPNTDECENGGDAIDPITDFVLGSRSDFDPDRYFQGALDEVRFYDRAILAEEVTRLSLESTDEAPVVDAGVDRTVYGPAGVILDGSVSDDGPPSDLVVGWSRISGPGSVTFADAGSPRTGATFSAPGTYVLRLSASDAVARAAVVDEVTLTVLAETEEADLVGYWPMNEGTGSLAADTSGLEHDAAALGAPAWILGTSGLGLALGAADAIVVDTSVLLAPDLATRGFTFAAWVRVSAGEEGTVASKGMAGSAHYRLYFDDPENDGRSDLFAEVGGATNATAAGVGDRIDDGSWHHVALIHDATTGRQRLYVDGEAVGSAVASGAATSADTLRLGDDLAGDFDEVRFYRRALSAGEVQELFAPEVCEPPTCVPIFLDGFETGDTTLWSSVQSP